MYKILFFLTLLLLIIMTAYALKLYSGHKVNNAESNCQTIKSTIEIGSDVFFESNSFELTENSKNRLNSVIHKIRRTGYQETLRITGNTNDINSIEENQRLSERRADAVKEYLASKGFNPDEMIVRGLGETKPKYPNTLGNRHKNDRVDIEYAVQEVSCKLVRSGE